MFNVYKITCPTEIVKPDSIYGDYSKLEAWQCNMEWSMKMIESECVHKNNPKTPRFSQLNIV